MSARRRAARPTLLLGAAAALAFAGGCASTTDVSLDAVCRPTPAAAGAASYRLASRNPAHDEHTLRYKEAASHVRTALSGRGLYEAPAGVTPDLVVEFDYGIEPPRMRYRTVTEPVYVEITRPAGAPPQRRTVVGRPPSSADPRGEEAEFHLVGFTEVPRPFFTREKYLAVAARPNTAAADRAPASDVWRVQASIEDETEDLRRCLPVLAAAVMKQLGEPTDGRVTAKIRDRDTDIAFIHRGL